MTQFPNQNHPDHGRSTVDDHHEDPSAWDKGRDGSCCDQEDDLGASHGHLHQERSEPRESEPIDDNGRKLHLVSHLIYSLLAWSLSRNRITGSRTYSCDSTIAEVDAKVEQDQEPGLRVLDGHPGLLPFEGSRVQHAGLVRERALYGDRPLPLGEDNRSRWGIRQEGEKDDP